MEESKRYAILFSRRPFTVERGASPLKPYEKKMWDGFLATFKAILL